MCATLNLSTVSCNLSTVSWCLLGCLLAETATETANSGSQPFHTGHSMSCFPTKLAIIHCTKGMLYSTGIIRQAIARGDTRLLRMCQEESGCRARA